jgi:hypothetical protein
MLKRALGILVIIVAIVSSCQKDNYADSDTEKVNFTTDTLFFDTVFTTIGSSTRNFKIKNPYKSPILISSLKLAGGNTSPFRINVDGLVGTSFSDIEIRAEDSIWIFAEVTVDPNLGNLPFIIKDSIVFTTNGIIQDVNLVAFGQNAIYHRPAKGQSSFVLNCSEVWTNDTPHVVYGIAVIDSMCELTIKEGTQVHFHNNGALLAYYGGSLKIKGTASEPVVLQGDRLEPWYDDVSGQWLGIYLFPLSFDNSIKWAIIKNARIGVQCDTINSVQSSNPTLTLKNTIIKNCSSIGISGRGTDILAYNTVVSNCGEYCGAFSLGGKYNFYHCTFGSYSGSNSDKPAVLLNNWYKDANKKIITRDLTEANFFSSIIYGSKNNEILLSEESSSDFNFQFKDCLIKVDNNETKSSLPEFVNCIVNETPDFENTSINDFHLKDNSKAINVGDINIVNNLIPFIGKDLDNELRTLDGQPDLGAYEYKTQ